MKNKNELFDKVVAQGELLLKKGASNLQTEIQQGLAHLTEQKRLNFGEEYSAMFAPFLVSHIERQFNEPYHGDVFVWDIDKTYLQTHFSSLRGLAAIPFESAEDKLAVPGSVPLLRALQRGAAGDLEKLLPLYFVSGSPPQLRQVIQEKMQLDGVAFDGLMFKDQWGLVKAGRPKDVKKQMGYKLSALLTLKLHIPGQPRFYCFGDDVESDAEVFSLFSDVLKGLSKNDLKARLKKAEVHVHDANYIFSVLENPMLQESIAAYKNTKPVEKIFIHLDRRTKPERLTSELVHPCYNFLQAAMILSELGKIPEATLLDVANDLRRNKTAELALAIYVKEALDRFSLPDKLARLIFQN